MLPGTLGVCKGKVLKRKQEWTCCQHTQCSLGSYLRRFWGCCLGIRSSPEETKRLRELPGRSSRVLLGTDLPPTYTKFFAYLPWWSLGLLPRTSAPSRAGQNTLADACTGHAPASHFYQQSVTEYLSAVWQQSITAAINRTATTNLFAITNRTATTQ